MHFSDRTTIPRLLEATSQIHQSLRRCESGIVPQADVPRCHMGICRLGACGCYLHHADDVSFTVCDDFFSKLHRDRSRAGGADTPVASLCTLYRFCVRHNRHVPVKSCISNIWYCNGITVAPATTSPVLICPDLFKRLEST